MFLQEHKVIETNVTSSYYIVIMSRSMRETLLFVEKNLSNIKLQGNLFLFGT